jgi:hypothetical protein
VRLRSKGYQSVSDQQPSCLSKWSTRPWPRPAKMRCVGEITPTDHRSQALSFETGDDGRFDFGGVPLGKYELSAAKRGYLTQSYQQHEDFWTAIAVGRERVSEDLLFNLMPQAIFYGTVNDEAGEPIRRAQVHLYEDPGLGRSERACCLR